MKRFSWPERSRLWQVPDRDGVLIRHELLGDIPAGQCKTVALRGAQLNNRANYKLGPPVLFLLIRTIVLGKQ